MPLAVVDVTVRDQVLFAPAGQTDDDAAVLQRHQQVTARLLLLHLRRREKPRNTTTHQVVASGWRIVASKTYGGEEEQSVGVVGAEVEREVESGLQLLASGRQQDVAVGRVAELDGPAFDRVLRNLNRKKRRNR